MQPRNVILSLILVLGFLVFAFIKTRFFEPKRKLIFNRNPSRIKYAQVALCRMDCYLLTANDVTEVIRNGEINRDKSDLSKRPCPVFKLHGWIKKGKDVWISVEQCGRIAKIIDCYEDVGGLACNCTDNESRPVSFYKNKN
jgi:hypothetical protein